MIRFAQVVLLALLAMGAPQLVAAQEWTSMFNGKTLEGWTQKNGTASYRVEDGAIVGRTQQGSPNSFMCTVLEYGDFELEFETKVDAGLNSGVQIRSQTDDQPGKHTVYNTGRVNGPQIELEVSGDTGAEAGYIYGEATGRGWLVPDDKRIPHKHLRMASGIAFVWWPRVPASRRGLTANRWRISPTKKSTRLTPRASSVCRCTASVQIEGRTKLGGETCGFGNSTETGGVVGPTYPGRLRCPHGRRDLPPGG